MKHRSAAVIVGILISMGAVCLLLGAYLRSDGFMQKAAGLVQEQAAELLATRVEVGAVSVDSFHSLSLRDLVIYDQQDAVLAKAKSAQVSFSLLSLLREPSAAAVSKVSLVSPEVWLSQQADNRWNYEAIIEGGSSRNAFAGKVSVQDGQLTARVQGQQLALTDLQGQLDFAAQPSVRLTLEGALQGATVRRLALVWGVNCIYTPEFGDTDSMIMDAVKKAVEQGYVKFGDIAVVAAGVPLGVQGNTNMIKVHTVGNAIINGVGIGKKPVTGHAKLITSANLDDFQEGDILVVKTLTPEVSQILPLASAIITEEGGLSSEGAIAGLHYDIPVIVNVEKALDTLEHGKLISVDPKRGVVYQGRVQMM